MKGWVVGALCLVGWLCCLPVCESAAAGYVVAFKSGGSVNAYHYVDKGDRIELYLANPEGFLEVGKTSIADIRRRPDSDAVEIAHVQDPRQPASGTISGTVSGKAVKEAKPKGIPWTKDCSKLDYFRKEALTYCEGYGGDDERNVKRAFGEAFKKNDPAIFKKASDLHRNCKYYRGLVKEMEERCR